MLGNEAFIQLVVVALPSSLFYLKVIHSFFFFFFNAVASHERDRKAKICTQWAHHITCTTLTLNPLCIWTHRVCMHILSLSATHLQSLESIWLSAFSLSEGWIDIQRFISFIEAFIDSPWFMPSRLQFYYVWVLLSFSLSFPRNMTRCAWLHDLFS